jgi:hypothetical protein
LPCSNAFTVTGGSGEAFDLTGVSIVLIFDHSSL